MTNQLDAGCEGLRGDLPREAFGVRPACWRFPLVPRVLKREQAPRTPNASRNLAAALPLGVSAVSQGWVQLQRGSQACNPPPLRPAAGFLSHV